MAARGLTRCIHRTIFQQGPGSNYRRLNYHEKRQAKESFLQKLQNVFKSKPILRKVRNEFKMLAATVKPPEPPKRPDSFSTPFEQIADDFYWVNDPNNSHELTNYLQDELMYTEACSTAHMHITDDLVKEFRTREPQADSKQIVQRSGFKYYINDLPILALMRADLTGQEKMILNMDQLRNHKLLKEDAGVQEFLKEDPFPLLNTEFSPDGRFVAFLFELPDSNMLVVKDTVLDDFTGFLVRDVGHYFVFDDLNGLYFVKLNLDTKKGQKVFRADLTPPKSEEDAILEDARQRIAKKPVLRVDLVYEEKDYNFSVDITNTLSRQYILITSDNNSDDKRIRANEIRFRASNRREGDWILLREREEGVFYDAKQLEEYFYIMVTSPSEPNSKILRTKIPSTYRYDPVPAETSDRTDVTTDFLGAEIYIPYSDTVSIISFETFKHYIVIIQSDTETSLEYIKLINLQNSTTAVVSYQDYEGQLKIANNKSYRIHQIPTEYFYDSDSFVYRLSTLNSPDKIINYNMNTRLNTVLRLDYHMPDVRLEDYTSERIILSANDGERIPVTLIYNKNLVRENKDNYVVLQSYGGDRENTHNFTLSPHWISMLDRGFLWAIPHVRGSADVTTQWFLKGSGQNKIRHLQDFLDVAVSLASEKIASHLCAYSDNPSGGLTIASVILKEPQIFESAAIRNPITDVFQYLNNKRLMTEFGDMQDKAVYDVIKSYSPYHQPVPSADLPKLMISADFDHECAFHAIRLNAKLREVSAKFGNLIVYHEFPTWVPDPMKRAEEFGFIMSHSMLESRDR